MSEITREEFSKIYREQFVPVLNKIEPERAEAYKKINPLGYIMLAAIVILVLGFFLEKGLLIAIGAILLIPSLSYSVYLSQKIRTRLKKEVFPKILSLFGNLYLSENKNVVSYNDIKSMGLFPRFTSKSDDDIIIGIHQGLNFAIDECKLTHTERHGKSTVTVTDFGGLLVKIQMKKKFSGKTVVGMKGYISKVHGYDKVLLEDVNFMKNREVYSTDQIESRYILTTSFMERLQYLGETFSKERINSISAESMGKSAGHSFDMTNIVSGIKNSSSFLGNLASSFIERESGVSAAFIEGYVYLFIPSGEDFFEIQIEDTLLNETKYYHIYREIQSILSIIEYLNLNSKTGL